MLRAQGRAHNQLRDIRITYDIYDYAAASVLFEQGKTKVLCAVTLQNNVPPFLKGKRTGWLTAEYAMLPTATHIRKERENSHNPNGRSIEISRIIGRVLRSVINLSVLGERTIVIDCDVVQADGSTRTACITGAYLALKLAVKRWLQSSKISQNILSEEIAAVSVGCVDSTILLDLDFVEDSSIEADFNFIMTQSGRIIEIQGSAEKKPITWEDLEKMSKFALKGITDIFQITQTSFEPKPFQPFNGIRIKTPTTV